MHVLFLAEDYTPLASAQGGVRVSLAQQAEGLAREIEVTVLSPRRLYPPLGRYRETGVPQKPPSGATAEEEASSRVRILRPCILHVPILWPITEPLQLLAATAQALRGPARGASIVHGHRAFPMGLGAVLLGRLFRRPSVVTVYGTDVNVEADSSHPFLRCLVRAGLKADRLIAVSRSLAERAQAIGISADRIHTVPSGVDLVRFAPGDRGEARRELGLPADRFLFLSMNLFDPVKGHAVLIAAMAELARQKPGRAFLAMTGDGPERPRIAAAARALGIEADVRFAGLRPYGELPLWVRAADALVLPSLNEGMPLTVLEGFAAGKPVIGSAIGGIPEVAPDERYGILVPPGDPQALAAALAAAIDRPWDGAVIRARAQSFAWPAVVAGIRAIYSELAPEA